MKRDLIPLYDNTIQANRVGSFIRGDVVFDIIKPGYDSQGNRQIQWTQFVVDGIPVFEIKLRVDIVSAQEKFDSEWDKHIGDDADLLKRSLEAAKKERLRKYKNEAVGKEPAPALTVDGRKEGKNYRS